MITPSETVIQQIKPFLLSNILIKSLDKEIYKGKLINIIVKDFNIKFVFKGKKVDLLYPFDLYKSNNVLYFDYTIDTLSCNEPLIRMKLNEFNKKSKNKKYLDKVVTIEQV